VILKTD